MTLDEEIQQKKRELKEALQECLEADRAIQPAQQLRTAVFNAFEEGTTVPFEDLLALQRYTERIKTAREKALQFDAIAQELASLQRRKAAGFG